MKYRSLFSERTKKLISEDEWLITQGDYIEQEKGKYETIFALSNGRMGNRGVHIDGSVQNQTKGNYLQGVFDKSEALQRELCNTPDWTPLKIYKQRQLIGLESSCKVRDYSRVLDMKKGILLSHCVLEDAKGNATEIETIKLLSRSHTRCGLIRTYVKPLNYSGTIEVENIIDGCVCNFNEFPRFRVKHLKTEAITYRNQVMFMESQTRDDATKIITASCIEISNDESNQVSQNRCFRPYGEVACEFMDFQACEGKVYTIDKYVSIANSLYEKSLEGFCASDLKALKTFGFMAALALHSEAYAKLWDFAQIDLIGNKRFEKALRFNVFHLMSTPNPENSRTNIGAKLIHGEEYGGHTFWDTECFILPFFNFVFPNTARQLVKYRYNLLEAAKGNAKDAGYLGAKYPWESADTGYDVCPALVIEPDGTYSKCQVSEQEVHITADVIYGMLKYVATTGDEAFLRDYGLEMLVETTRYWLSRLEYNELLDRYEINKITGPDEWHEDVNNNFYTNYMAKWNMEITIQHLNDLKSRDGDAYNKLVKKLNFTEKLEDIQDVANRIYLKNRQHIIEQFDGYFDLVDRTITEFDENNMPIMPEKLKGHKKGETTILKQSDVMMLMFLFQEAFSKEAIVENFEFYNERTLHRSSLSPSINCMMSLTYGDQKTGIEYLERSLFVDLEDKQGNVVEGIHGASAGGSWQCLVFGGSGLVIDRESLLSFKPKLEGICDGMRFTIHHLGNLLRIEIDTNDMVIYSKERLTYTYNNIQKETVAIEEWRRDA